MKKLLFILPICLLFIKQVNSQAVCDGKFRNAYGVGASLPLGVAVEAGVIGQTSRLSLTGGFMLNRGTVSYADSSGEFNINKHEAQLGIITTAMYRVAGIEYQYGLNITAGYQYTDAGPGVNTGVALLLPMDTFSMYFHIYHNFTDKRPTLRVGVYF